MKRKLFILTIATFSAISLFGCGGVKATQKYAERRTLSISCCQMVLM